MPAVALCSYTLGGRMGLSKARCPLAVLTLPGLAAMRRTGQMPANDQERLDTILSSLLDVPTIMQTMPEAIRKAAAASKM